MKMLNRMFCPLLAVCFIAIMYSCEQVQIPGSILGTKEVRQVFIETRMTGEDTPVYPIRVFAFRASDGRLAGEQTLADADEPLSIGLPEGAYNLFVIAGVNGYVLSEKIEKADQKITLENGFTQTGALMHGCSYVNLQEDDITVSIQMNYQVCELSCTLQDVPEDVQQVELTVSPVYKSLTLNGEFSDGGGSATIPASPTDQTGVWQIPSAYLWGTAGSQTVLSVKMTGKESGTQIVSSTLKRAFEPSVPYLLSGSSREGVYITGELEFNGWEPIVEIPFHYGEDEIGGTEVGEGEFLVDDLPAACSVWNNHVVAYVTEVDDNTADLLLISRLQWAKVSSATGTDPDQASSLAADYKEDDLDNWRMPSSEEAKQLHESYSDPYLLNDLNNAMVQVRGNTVLCADGTEDGVSIRYLCNDALSSFPFGTDGSVSAAGDKRTYRLLLVRTVRVVKR